MKKNIFILASTAAIFFMQGCYTVIWTPDIPMPEYYETDDYYYGDNYYVTYYGYPWWIDVAPAYNTTVVSPERTQHDRNPVRNSNGERNPGNSDRPIIQTGTVTVGSGSGNTGGSSGSTDSGRIRTDEQKDKSPSESSTSGSSNKRSNSGSNDDNTRNSNGSRNSGGRK